MRKASVTLALALMGFPLGMSGASAQDMSFEVDETEETPQQTQQSSSGDVIGDLAASDQSASTESREAAPGSTAEAREEIYAVQRIYALRLNRVEFAPSGIFSLNDPFIGHNGVGAALNFWWTNVLAVGVNFNWYQGLENESDLNFYVRRSTRLAVPVNNYQFGAALNFTYVPIYGKFSFFNEFIFQYDAYVLAGVGMLMTRPLPVIDPEVRSFDWEPRIAFNIGIGLRVFLSRWLAIFAEIRDYMYPEKLEALEVALGNDRYNKDTWAQSSPAFVNNVTGQVGLTIFLPFDFDYHRPR
jgi:outer membrane beta-barrel protein